MKGVVALIGIGVFIMMLGAIMLGLNTFRGTAFTEPHIITTDGSTTQVTTVLANKVLDDATVNINITSSEATDAPIPYLYTYNNKQLTITGLAASKTRTLSVAYKVPSQDPFTDVAARYFPMFLILGALSIIGGIIYGAVETARGH